MKNTPHSTDRVRPGAAAFRRTALSAACLLALSAGARAQSGAYDVNYPSTQALYLGGYTLSLTEKQDGTGALSGSAVGVGTRSTLSGSAGAATPVTLAGNAVGASGSGNQSTSLVDLGLLSGSGMGVMTGQVMSGTANTTTGGLATTSKVQDAAMAVTQTGMGPAAITIDGNTLSATTTLNRSNTLVSGSTPATFSSTTVGRITLTQDTSTQESGNPTAPTAGSTASVNVGNYQSAYNAGSRAGSGALASNVDVTLSLSGTTNASGTGTPVLSSPLALTSNTVSADYTGNTASTVYSAGAGSGAFTGSVAVTNAQNGYETLTVGAANKTAEVSGSGITADLRSTTGVDAAQTDLTGTLTLSGNRIAATSTVNTAGTLTASGAVRPGNAIVIDGVTSLSGAASPTSLSIGTAGNRATVGADLLLTSMQLGASARSSVTGAEVTAAADNVGAAGVIALSGNTVEATATANLAGNLLYASATNLAATSAATNIQWNMSSPSEATNTGTAIRAGVGVADVASSGNLTVSGNTIDAAARGNRASTDVTLSATTLTAVASSGASGTVTANTNSQTATTGIAAMNVQNNTSALTGTVSSGTVSANFTDTGLAGGTPTAVDALRVTLEGNRIAASAEANTATTSTTLSATNATVQAVVANGQFAASSATSASVTGAGTTLVAGGVSGASTLTVDGNATAATASINDARNTLSVAVTNLTVGPSALPGSTTTGGSPTVNAALGVASTQEAYNASSATTQTTDGFATMRVGDAAATTPVGVASGTLSVGGNTASAAAVANRSANALDLSVTNLDTTGNAATRIAGVASYQNETQGTTATVGAASAPSAPLFGVQFQQALTGSDASVSGNTASASATGNTATNRLTVAGVNLSSAAPASGTPGSVNAGSASVTTSNEFAVANAQQAYGANTSSATNVVVGIDGTGTLGPTAIGTSDLAVAGNAISAESRNNNAANALSLGGFATLSSGASLGNAQSATVTSSATVSDAIVRIGTAGATAVTGSALALTGNRVGALAIGNSASNALSASAAELSGNAAPSGSSSASPSWTNAVGDFGLASTQTQNGMVTAATEATQTVDLAAVSGGTLTGAAVSGGAVTVDGNTTRAVAQSSSVGNSLTLSGTNVSGVRAALANGQQATSTATATQTNTTGASFSVEAGSLSGTPVSVSGNAILASAGQNEAFNAMSVSGTAVSGRSGTSFAVLNDQMGASGVTSNAMPGLLGVSSAGVTNGSATVAGNAVTAKSNVNYASNALTLDAQSTLSGNGLVQSNQGSYGPATATVGDMAGTTTSTIGIAAPVAADGIALNGTSLNISGNSLNAQVGGNSVSNALNATAVSSIGAGTAPTFAVLNTQASTAPMTAQLAYANVGAWGAGTGGAFGGTAVTVSGNQASATAYANTASNTVAMSALPGSQNAASTSVGNTQSSNGAVSATASNVNFGATVSGASGGGAIMMSGNMTVAQATGNTAVNRVIGR